MHGTVQSPRDGDILVFKSFKMAAPMSDHAEQKATEDGDDKSKTSSNSSHKVEDYLTDITDSSHQRTPTWNERRRHANCLERRDFACKHSEQLSLTLRLLLIISAPCLLAWNSSPLRSGTVCMLAQRSSAASCSSVSDLGLYLV